MVGWLSTVNEPMKAGGLGGRFGWELGTREAQRRGRTELRRSQRSSAVRPYLAGDGARDNRAFHVAAETILYCTGAVQVLYVTPHGASKR